MPNSCSTTSAASTRPPRTASAIRCKTPVDGTRIPRLADVFALTAKAGNSAVRFNIETKIDPRAPQATLPPEEFARAVVRAIRAGGMANRATIQSFDWRTLKVVQAEAPEIPTVYLSARQNWFNSFDAAGTWTAGIRYATFGSVPKMVKAAGGKIWSPYFADVDAAKLAEARCARHCGRGLDRKRPGGYRTHDGPGRGGHHQRPPRPRAHRDAKARDGVARAHARFAMSGRLPAAKR